MFNVITYDPNHKEFVSYDVIPYFIKAYKEREQKNYYPVPKTYDEFKKFVIDEGHYQFWGRCEYEIILVDWPCQKVEKKIDVWDQIKMNLDLITEEVIKTIYNGKQQN